MPKKFCISTKGLSKDERQEFATELNDFVENKKEEFQERKESQEESDQ